MNAQRLLGIVFALTVAACGEKPAERTPETAPAPGATRLPADAAPKLLDKERLLAEAPANWRQVFHSDRPGMRMVEYVPAETSAGDWTEKVAFESFTGNPLPTPADLLAGIANDQRATCDTFAEQDTFAGDENGYATVVKLMVCHNNPVTRKGQVTLVKSIQGEESFYVITRAARTAPIEAKDTLPLPAERMAEWSLYLRAITVCELGSDAHPCPPEEPAPQT